MKLLTTIILATILCLPTICVAEEPPLVSRALFCTAITDREPADAPEVIGIGQQTVYFFTEILNAKDQIVKHNWFYNDIPIADVPMKIGADRWRTWSTKQVWHLTAGTLKVQIADASGSVLAEKEIVIQ